jgi:tRNA A-37 threonylcarbamoyl transferase component Bud32
MPEQARNLDDALVALAGSVADRTPVDWANEQERTPDLAPAMARLREIAVLEAAHARVLQGLPPDMLFSWGPLQVLERIGEGSFAEVFRARDAKLQREVALKLRRRDIDGPALGAHRWIEEARRLARVRHPNVVAILGADVHTQRAGIWTELVRGHTLEQWIETHGPLGPREAAGVGADLCGALAAVHAAGLIHGDVTTRNVMREGSAGTTDGSGRIVLMDFGSAHDARAADLAVFGTPLFAAPEVLVGQAPDVRSDVYSLGVVLYRLLTARHPVEAGSIESIYGQLSTGARVALRTARPDLPAALIDAVERACEPDRARRFASPAELERALAAAMPIAITPLPGARRRAPWLVAAAALLALVAVAVLATRGLRGTGSEGAPGAGADPPANAGPASAPAGAANPARPETEPVGAAGRSATAAALDVESTLYRVTAGAREPLRTGDLVAPGDELALEIQARAPMHVYVLTEDQQGAVFVLFPLEGRGASNPLAPGARHRLPGREGSQELSWQVTEAGGRETFLIVASPEPLKPVAEIAAAIPEPRADAPVAYPALPPEAMARLRAVGGVVHRTSLPTRERASMLAALARDLGAPGADHTLWIRLIVLENPMP